MRCHISDFESVFRNRTKRFFDKAKKYTEGLIRNEMRNIERISEDTGVDYYQMQHFITESNWDARELIDKVAVSISSVLPKRKMTGLIIDESGWVKKGAKSVGVGHQYCGNVGKVSNSQVAVFTCLSNGDFASMIYARLNLPKDWCNDAKRCQEADIPQERMTFKSKLELAAEIVIHQKEQGIVFDFVTADGYYGNDASFARAIENLGSVYILDIHSDTEIYLERPELVLPEKKGLKGTKPKRLRTSFPGIKVNPYLSSLEDEDWQTLNVRKTTKGVLRGEYHFAKVYIWDKSIDRTEQRLLVIHKTTSCKGTVEIKYSFTNANLEQYEPESLAYMQAEMYFIEHGIKESKQILGMDQFQTRKWLVWQHQIALNFLVSSFILMEKRELFEEIPLLSARDVKEMVLLELYEQMTQDQMMDRINKRHAIRQRDINLHYKKKSNLSQ